MSELGRRKFIKGASAAWIAAAGAGNYALAMRDLEGVVAAILDRRLGPFTMSDGDRRSVVALALETARQSGASDTSAWALSTLYPVIWAAAALPEELARKIEVFERQIVTAFLLSTDYLSKSDPETQNVRWSGAAAVCSPFARF